MSSVLLESGLILALILANGVLAMSELAVVASRKERLQQRAADGDVAAAMALQLASAPGNLLSAVQLGITLVGILAGAFGGATLATQLAAWLATLPGLASYNETFALILVVLGITYLSLVLGELVPKRLALNNPERIASVMARPLYLLTRVAAPVVHLLTASTELVLRILRAQPSPQPPVTPEEIEVLVAQGADAGVFAQTHEAVLTGALRLGELRAWALMAPRTEVLWLDLEDPPDVVAQKITGTCFSRLPVAKGSLDEVVGVVEMCDLLASCLAGRPFDLKATLHPALFLPESTPAIRVLERFKETGQAMALLIDEYGGLQGLTTLTDILEAVVGEANRLGEVGDPPAVQRSDGSWLLDGLLGTEEVKHFLELSALPGEEEGSYETLGGLMMACLGRVPTVGDSFPWSGWTFEVVDMDARRVDKVLARRDNGA